MTELKLCPCCGPKAFIVPSTKCDPQAGKHCWTAELRCRECGLNISRTAATEKEALHEAIEAWNTRAEQTCKNRGGHMGCSECGWYLNENARYYDGCGAKVVD